MRAPSTAINKMKEKNNLIKNFSAIKILSTYFVGIKIERKISKIGEVIDGIANQINSSSIESDADEHQIEINNLLELRDSTDDVIETSQ